MKVSFQADADLDEDIIWGVKRIEPMIDFQTADEAGIRGLDDSVVLTTAANENRILISHDRRTMPHHFADFILNQTSPGVFIISQGARISRVIDDIILIWFASEPEEWSNTISDLPFPK
jgi:predicted nuclease of predicted toxin-antitoxin system